MRKMKESGIPWIKELPCDWKVEKGKLVLNLLKRPIRNTDEVVTCFRDGEVILRSLRRTEGFTMSDKEIGYQGINEGDIVIHGMDGFAGSMGVSKSTGKGSPVLIVCSPKNGNNPQYIIYYLKTLAMTDVFIALATGIRERSCDLRWNKISDLEFAIPSPKEQGRIVAYLDKKCSEIDSLISLQDDMIVKLQEYKQSVITEAVTRGLDPSVPMKDSGIEWIGMIPEFWVVKRLKFSCKIFGRIGFRGYRSDDLKADGDGAITLSPSNMKDMKMDFSKCTYLSWEKYYESPEIMINDGDVLMVKTGSTYGKCSYVEGLPKESTINPQIVVFKEHHDLSKYISYYFQTPMIRALVDTSVVGGTIPTISQEKILNYILIFPPLEEQHQITDFLDQKCSEIDSLIDLKKQKIETLKEYKKSLIYECVTGKKEIA